MEKKQTSPQEGVRPYRVEYQKSPQHRYIPADGQWLGLNGYGKIILNFFNKGAARKLHKNGRGTSCSPITMMAQDIFVRVDRTAQSTSNVAIDSFYLPVNNFESRSADWWKENSALMSFAGGQHDASNLSTTAELLPFVVTNGMPSKRLTELVKLEAANGVLIKHGGQAAPRLILVREGNLGGGNSLRVRTFKGHRVLIPVISQDELAEEMFGPK